MHAALESNPEPPVLIETNRLILRPLTTADLDEVVDMHAMPEVIQTMGQFERHAAASRLEGNEREWDERGYGLMSIVERDTGRFLGRSGLKYWPQFDETEVGWVLRPEAWGQGFATEAGQACVDWGLGALGLPYLTSLIVPDNVRSINVAKRLGMRPLRRDVLMELPVVVYSIDRSA
jgi:RimJ/RimL family protein N-acetyltransferase